jgi:hypothetical protein
LVYFPQVSPPKPYIGLFPPPTAFIFTSCHLKFGCGKMSNEFVTTY